MSSIPFDGYKWNRAKKNYAFLRQAEQEQRPFTLQEMCEATGYSLATINKYRRRLWKPFLQQLPMGRFACNGLLNCSWEAFAQLHAFIDRDLAIAPTPPLMKNIEKEQSQEKEQHSPGNELRQMIAHFLSMLSEKVGG